MSTFEEQINQAKERESYISFELYCLLRSAILGGLIYEDSKCEFKEVIPEYPIGDKRADLVVFATRYSKHIEPFLVIEVKRRVYARPGLSIAMAIKRALSYARAMRVAITPFFAVYNGWELLIFRDITPYLIGAYAAICDRDQAKNLLLGLEEFAYKSKREILEKLPKHRDPGFLLKRVMPSIVKVFEEKKSKREALLKAWKRILGT